jgi:hypothetical protein
VLIGALGRALSGGRGRDGVLVMPFNSARHLGAGACISVASEGWLAAGTWR